MKKKIQKWFNRIGFASLVLLGIWTARDEIIQLPFMAWDYIVSTQKEEVPVEAEEAQVEVEAVETWGVKEYSQEEIEDLLIKYARLRKLSVPITFAITAHENGGFNQFAKNATRAGTTKNWLDELKKSDIGLMQVKYETAVAMAKELGLNIKNPMQFFDAEININIGTYYLAKYCIQPALASTRKDKMRMVAERYNGPKTNGQWEAGVTARLKEYALMFN